MSTKENIKEMKKFAITCLVLAVLITCLSIFILNDKSSDESFTILPIGAGILYAIGLTLLPKAIKLEKLNK